MKLATTIQEVIALLDEIIILETARKSRIAFFAVLYRNVTIKIKEGIDQEVFEDNPRMERLDVLFANRYLEAYYQYKTGKPTTQSWQHTFDQTARSKLLILQHILLGINAHINLDLGIITSLTAGTGNALSPLKNDFDHINKILAAMVQDMQTSINKVSPLLTFFEWIGKGREDKLAAFSITIARDEAWLFAQEYHSSSEPENCIESRDIIITSLGDKLTSVNSKVFNFAINIVRFFESKDVEKVVAVLRG
jgi:hypothetical protein